MSNMFSRSALGRAVMPPVALDNEKSGTSIEPEMLDIWVREGKQIERDENVWKEVGQAIMGRGLVAAGDCLLAYVCEQKEAGGAKQFVLGRSPAHMRDMAWLWKQVALRAKGHNKVLDSLKADVLESHERAKRSLEWPPRGGISREWELAKQKSMFDQEAMAKWLGLGTRDEGEATREISEEFQKYLEGETEIGILSKLSELDYGRTCGLVLRHIKAMENGKDVRKKIALMTSGGVDEALLNPLLGEKAYQALTREWVEAIGGNGPEERWGEPLFAAAWERGWRLDKGTKKRLKEILEDAKGDISQKILFMSSIIPEAADDEWIVDTLMNSRSMGLELPTLERLLKRAHGKQWVRLVRKAVENERRGDFGTHVLESALKSCGERNVQDVDESDLKDISQHSNEGIRREMTRITARRAHKLGGLA